MHTTSVVPTIRRGNAGDADTIKALVRAARLNPLGLNWRRFLVAEDSGQVVGIGQIKPHGDGSRELASLVVLPECRGQGIGTLIVQALLGEAHGPLYLMCDSPLQGYYARFGFQRLHRSEAPRYFRWMLAIASMIAPLSRLFVPGGLRIVVMRRVG